MPPYGSCRVCLSRPRRSKSRNDDLLWRVRYLSVGKVIPGVTGLILKGLAGEPELDLTSCIPA